MEGLIAAPVSKFVKVECKGCGNAQVIFDHAASVVKCVVCGAVLAEPRGGRADIKVPVARSF